MVRRWRGPHPDLPSRNPVWPQNRRQRRGDPDVAAPRSSLALTRVVIAEGCWANPPRSGHSEVAMARAESEMPKNVAVGVGLMEFPFSGAAAFWRWVDLCEAGGVDSIWQTDRLVSPTPFLECMSVMAALAGRTRRIKFGVNVLSLAMRDAVLVARQCATIDFLSNGRLLPAFGI